MTMNAMNINYSLSLFFFGVFEASQYLGLQKDMFDTLLFNCLLYEESDISSQLSIVKHCHRTFAPFTQSLGWVLPSFSDILSIYPDSLLRLRNEFLKIAMELQLTLMILIISFLSV
jgi:hypothetical protein